MTRTLRRFSRSLLGGAVSLLVVGLVLLLTEHARLVGWAAIVWGAVNLGGAVLVSRQARRTDPSTQEL